MRREVADLRVCGRQLHAHAAGDRRLVQVTPLGKCHARAITRNRADRITVSDDS
jgi:hypothetical protein